MEEYEYNNGYEPGIIRVRGKANEERIKQAAIKFMKKADQFRKKKLKEKSQNGNRSTS